MNMIMRKMNARSELFTESEISCQEFKTRTWVLTQEGHASPNTKTWFQFQTIGSKRGSLQELMKTIFSFQNQLQNDA